MVIHEKSKNLPDLFMMFLWGALRSFQYMINISYLNHAFVLIDMNFHVTN